jgi:hypothetical protein
MLVLLVVLGIQFAAMGLYLLLLSVAALFYSERVGTDSPYDSGSRSHPGARRGSRDRAMREITSRPELPERPLPDRRYC